MCRNIVVSHNVDRSQLLLDLRNDLFGSTSLCDITHDCDGLASGRFDLIDDSLQLILSTSDAGNSRPCRCERFCCSYADPGAGTGYNGLRTVSGGHHMMVHGSGKHTTLPLSLPLYFSGAMNG
jgi:hypothetical protein